MLDHNLDVGSVFISVLDKSPKQKKLYEPGVEDINRWYAQVADDECTDEQRSYSLHQLSDMLNKIVEAVDAGSSTGQEQEEKIIDFRELDSKSTVSCSAKGSLLPRIDECYTTTEVAKALRASRSQVQKLFESQKLIGFQPNGRNRYYPKVQFKDGYLVNGIKEVQETLGFDSIQAISFLVAPVSNMQDVTPFKLLRQGAIDVAVALAQKHRAMLLEVFEGNK